MSEGERIADQLRRAHEGEAWHGPSVREVLDGVNATQAAARPITGAHSIWELTLHIAAWEKAALRRLADDRAELTDEENWPPIVETSEAAWQQTLEALADGNLKLREEIKRLSDERLNEPIMEGMSSVYVTLHGVIQHTLYHAGQIAVLKKA